MAFTNAAAGAVNTVDWLSAAGTVLLVPVYQREYRWKTDGCERLVADFRAANGAPGDARRTQAAGAGPAAVRRRPQ